MNKDVDIQIPNIEKELSRSAATDSGGKQLKACLFTLVIYAREPRTASYLKELVDTILDKFPCRIIYIHVDKNAATSYLHTTVSTVSGRAESPVACDLINIDVSKDQLFRIPFLVIPHFVPDLPVYLLWGQDPFAEKEIFPHLHSFAARVIFDSECSDNLSLFCQEMQSNICRLKMEIMDINWALVSNWRDMLCRLFDTSEKALQLNECKSIVINYNGNKNEIFQHPEVRAIYLQGWLAARFGWDYQKVEKIQGKAFITYAAKNNPVIVVLVPQKDDNLPPGALISLEITLLNGDNYVIGRKKDLDQVIVHACTNHHCEVPFTLPLPNIHRGLTFMKEIFYSTLGDHYCEMLQKISQIDFSIIRNGN